MLKDHLLSILTPTPDADRVRAAVEGHFANLSSLDMDARLARWAPDAKMEDPAGSKPSVGHEELRAFWMSAAHMKVTGSVKRMVICGNEANYEFEAHLDAGDDGQALILGFGTAKVDSTGRIAEMRAFFDKDCFSWGD